MAISYKYGKVNIPKIGADEPVFILRAQDWLAEATIQIYQVLAASHGSTLSKDFDKQIKSFQQGSGKRKMPD